ncbi:MAG: hypothetical protein [Bacteriophage sp.]|nr:MAG: hypothetical protein [Bacteriophage sp.]
MSLNNNGNNINYALELGSNAFINNITENHLIGLVYSYCIAKLISSKSRDPRLKVGSTIFLDNGKVFNSNFNSCPDKSNISDLVFSKDENNVTHPALLHSELKTLLNFHKSTSLISCGDLTSLKAMVITHSPCLKCASAIFEFGIGIVYYTGIHDNNEGINFLVENGIDVRCYTKHKPLFDEIFNNFSNSILNNTFHDFEIDVLYRFQNFKI